MAAQRGAARQPWSCDLLRYCADARGGCVEAVALSDGSDFGTPQPLAGIVQMPRWPFSNFPREARWHLFDGEDVVRELEPRVTSELPDAAAAIPDWRWPGDRG